jgi:Holliday junction resolvase RusA-like endonuclease
VPDRLNLVVVSDPVAKARPRVALRGGRAHAYTPAKTQEAEWRIRQAFSAKYPNHQPWSGPIDLDVTAWLAMPISTPKRLRPTALPTKRPDADNYLKTVLDALNGVAFVDDSQVVSLSFEKQYAQDGVAPFWEIELTQFTATPMALPAATPGVADAERHLRPGLRPTPPLAEAPSGTR